MFIIALKPAVIYTFALFFNNKFDPSIKVMTIATQIKTSAISTQAYATCFNCEDYSDLLLFSIEIEFCRKNKIGRQDHFGKDTLTFALLPYSTAEIRDVAGDTSKRPIQPTNVSSTSAATVFEFKMLIKGVAWAIYTIITER